MRKEGFNIRATKLDGSNFVQVENSGQGGAGVAASWVGSLTHNMAMIQPLLTSLNWKMGEILPFLA